MDLSQLTFQTVLAFILVLIRVSGLMIAAPILGHSSIPPQIKIGLSVVFAILLFSIHVGTAHALSVVPRDLLGFALMAGQELVIGLLLGYCAGLLFSGVQMAGEFISTQMGLSVVNMLDPINHTQVPVLGQFYYFFALLLFLNLNIHYGLILGLSRAFDLIPLGGHLPHIGLLAERFVMLTRDIFIVGLMLGLPVLGILLVTEIALAMVAKVMPQMNIFVVGLPLKVGIGLWTLIISLPFASRFLSDQYATLVQEMMGLFRS